MAGPGLPQPELLSGPQVLPAEYREKDTDPGGGKDLLRLPAAAG